MYPPCNIGYIIIITVNNYTVRISSYTCMIVHAVVVAPMHSNQLPVTTSLNCLRELKPLSSKKLSAMHQPWDSYRYIHVHVRYSLIVGADMYAMYSVCLESGVK